MKEKDNARNGWGKKCLQMEIQGILQNMHTVHAAQFKEKKKKDNRKVGQRSKWAFLQRRHPGGHKVHKKMLSVPNH